MITFNFEGQDLQAEVGQSVAAALIANRERISRHTRIEAQPRGIFCGIGVCFDCLISIDGVSNLRSCITEVRDGMVVRVQDGN